MALLYKSSPFPDGSTVQIARREDGVWFYKSEKRWNRLRMKKSPMMEAITSDATGPDEIIWLNAALTLQRNYQPILPFYGEDE